MGIVLAGLLVGGCMTPQGQPDNTATGALAGGAVGAIIGSTTRNPGAGAAVGAAVGAVAGGAIGHSIDQAQDAQQAQATAQSQQQAQQTQPLTIEDIKAMVRARIGDDVIISQIRNSHTVYHLKTADIISLKKAGVSEKIIVFMINTQSSSTAPAVVTGAQPPPLIEPVIAMPGPDYYWIDGSWIWLEGGWVWRSGYWHAPRYRGGYDRGGFGHDGGFGHEQGFEHGEGSFGHDGGFGHEGGFGRH